MPSVSAFFDRRLVLLAALAAILAAAALAIPRADAQTLTGGLAHAISWNPAANGGNGAPADLSFTRNSDDLFVKVWIVNTESVATDAVPTEAQIATYGTFGAQAIGVGLLPGTDAAPDRGDIFSAANGGGLAGSELHTDHVTRGTFALLSEAATNGRYSSGPGSRAIAASHWQTISGDADMQATTKMGPIVFKLVPPAETLRSPSFYFATLTGGSGIRSEVNRYLQFISDSYREVSVYRIKDTDAGFAPCTENDMDDSCDDTDSPPEFGRAILMGSTLTKGNDANGNPIPAQFSDFDFVEVEIKDGGASTERKTGIVFHPELCPMAFIPGDPSRIPFEEHPHHVGSGASGHCAYNHSSFSDTSGDYGGTVGPFVAYTATKGSGATQTDGKVYVGYYTGTPSDKTLVASGEYEFTDDNAFVPPTDNADTTDFNEGIHHGRIGTYGDHGDVALRIGFIWKSSSPPSAIEGEYMVTGQVNAFDQGDDEITLNIKGKGLVRLRGTDIDCRDEGTNPMGTDCPLLTSSGDRADNIRRALHHKRDGDDDLSQTWQFTPLLLDVQHDIDNPEDITISGWIKNGTDRSEIPPYVAKVDPDAGAARVIAWLPDDADGRLGPGQVAQVAVGFHAGESLSVRYHGWPRRFWDPIGFNGATPTGFAPATSGRWRADFGDGYLVLNGPAVWSENGGKRLLLNAEGFNRITCVDRETVTGLDDAGQASCYMTNTSGVAPKITVDADAGDADITVTGNIPVWSMTPDAVATIPERTAITALYELPTNPVKYQRAMAFGQDRLRVGAVRQIETVTLSRKSTGGIPNSGTIRVGHATLPKEVVLSIRNAENAPSQITAISAITISVIGGGEISSPYCPEGELTTCTVNLDTEDPSPGVEGRESLRVAAGAMPSVISAIELDFKAPNRAGNTRIVATVIGLDGSTFAADPLQLVISGSASSVAVTGDEPRLLSFDTPDAGDDKDDRDTSSIRIAASDASGNAAEMPRNAQASLKQADGTAVASSAYVATIECTDAGRTNCSLVININQAAASPLASGGYVVTVSGSGITDLEVPITLAGKAKTINVELGDLPGVGQNWPVTIAVLDADGTPVADGTQLTLNARGVAAATSDVVLISKPNEDADGIAEAKTKNGMLSATLTVIARGRGVLSVSAVSGSGDSQVTDATAGGVVLDTRTAALPDEAYGGPVAFQSADGMPAVGVISRWRSATAGSAAQALAIVSDADVLWLHNGRAWIQYATGEDGATLPGSAPNFTIVEGDYLWFASTQ